jgi:hypothetical protein
MSEFHEQFPRQFVTPSEGTVPYLTAHRRFESGILRRGLRFLLLKQICSGGREWELYFTPSRSSILCTQIKPSIQQAAKEVSRKTKIASFSRLRRCLHSDAALAPTYLSIPGKPERHNRALPRQVVQDVSEAHLFQNCRLFRAEK